MVAGSHAVSGTSSVGVLITVFLLTVSNAVAQPDTLWTRTFGGALDEQGYCVQETVDGGYVVAGSTGTYGSGSSNLWLLRTDGSGELLWQKVFPGSSDSEGMSVHQTEDEGYIITGYALSPSESKYMWLIRADPLGNMIWNRVFGGDERDEGRSVQQVSDGGFVVAGFTQSYGADGADLWLVKTDADGNLIFSRTFGGTGTDMGYSVQETLDGGFIIAGYTTSFGSANAILVKTGQTGELQWQKTFGGSQMEEARFVRQTADGGYILTGSTSSYGFGSKDVWLIRTDCNGNIIWDRVYGGTGSDEGFSVRQTVDGGFVVTGYTDSFGAGGRDLWLIRTDSAGELLWDATFGGSSWEGGNSVFQTWDGGFIVAGYTRSYGEGGMDLWLIRTAPEQGIHSGNNPGPHVTCCPNPSSGQVTLTCSVPVGTTAVVSVHDLAGRRVATLLDGLVATGMLSVVWDPGSLGSGVYLARIATEQGQSSVKFVLCR